MEEIFQTDPLIEHVYIHFPFCLKKCGYCSFYSEIFSEEIKNKFLRNLTKEIKAYQSRFKMKPRTIYFGGGTPSLLQPEEIESILQRFNTSNLIEATLEINPVNVTSEYVNKLKKTNINRISMGAQSVLDKELKLLGRLHNSKQIIKAYDHLRAVGFTNISLDLIYGLPGQKKFDLLFSIEKFIELDPEHISTYCLSLDEDVPLFSQKVLIPDDEAVSEFFFLIRERLIAAGYEQYEISNFAKKGFESKHNICYWNDKFYLGLGPAATGYIDLFRYTNPASIKKYLQMDLFRNWEKISDEDHEKEFIFLTLRKTRGMNLTLFKEKFGADFTERYSKILEKFFTEKLLEKSDNYIRLTPEAYFVSNEIFSEFM
ncbi:MAG: radical SAM family heme chaperone HemW [Candidatus Cloacimonetes bacterium]|nr:radical SAM family heme chaperone HemW [Candidatus Cloacimonadota bacterium]MBL7148920.1 radical SAM family heme chaperone HemW [Candidatus Cloacimonadota bacterium]